MKATLFLALLFTGCEWLVVPRSERAGAEACGLMNRDAIARQEAAIKRLHGRRRGAAVINGGGWWCIKNVQPQEDTSTWVAAPIDDKLKAEIDRAIPRP